MYQTDGETFVYRNDRPARSAPAPRRTVPPPYEAGGQQLAAVLTERIARLEETVERLQATLTQCEDRLSQTESVRSQPSRHTFAEPEENIAATGERPAVRVLRMESLPDSPGAAPPAPRPDVKVSMYAGNGTTAILGHIRLQQEE